MPFRRFPEEASNEVMSMLSGSSWVKVYAAVYPPREGWLYQLVSSVIGEFKAYTRTCTGVSDEDERGLGLRRRVARPTVPEDGVLNCARVMDSIPCSSLPTYKEPTSLNESG